KKKKGFTLVELIAVIAILAILAAIIVPRVASYTSKATDAKKAANARTLASAIETYNADTDNASDIADADSLLASGTVKGKLMPKYVQTWPSDADIEAIAPAGTGSPAATKGSYAALKEYLSK
ncbi:prepilin-type N-terminal cleavage/methylation domain-containing protein, partial [Clostridium sp.]|uniref:prepilin-type N-terminal cleavage/methylation domain-containing protein n=1 Tax=Clostridium sp. TaxID=1506 RepID=UPI00258B9EE2